MHNFNVVWGIALLVFAVASSVFIAATDQLPIFYTLSLVPFVFGANSLQIGLRKLNEQTARKNNLRR